MGRWLFRLQLTKADHKPYKNVPREIATFAPKAKGTRHIMMQQYLFLFQMITSLDCRTCNEQKQESLVHILLDCTSTNAKTDRLGALICGRRKLEDILKA